MVKERNIDSGSISFGYKTLYLGAIITLILTGILCFVGHLLNIQYDLKDIVSLFTCGIIITTLIYNAKSLKLNFEANNEKLEFDKKKFEEEKEIRRKELEREKLKYTLDVSALWFKAEMASHVEIARSYLRGNKDKLMKGSIHDLMEDLDKQSEVRKALACILNFFENLAILLKKDLVDEESLKLCFKTLFIEYYKVLRKYIDEVQKTNSRYLMNYEEVARKWEKIN